MSILNPTQEAINKSETRVNESQVHMMQCYRMYRVFTKFTVFIIYLKDPNSSSGKLFKLVDITELLKLWAQACQVSNSVNIKF